LDNKLEVYAIGGTAMMLHSIKDATLDIDLVFNKEKDMQIFKRATEKLGYKEMDSFKIYGMKSKRPLMMTRGNERFDMFIEDVVYFKFTEEMKKRAKATHQFEKLTIKAADPHDIIIMKCATDRVKDNEDVTAIIKKTKIDWKIIIEEAKNQITHGKTMAAFELGEFLERLQKTGAHIPGQAIRELYKIVKKQTVAKI